MEHHAITVDRVIADASRLNKRLLPIRLQRMFDVSLRHFSLFLRRQTLYLMRKRHFAVLHAAEAAYASLDAFFKEDAYAPLLMAVLEREGFGWEDPQDTIRFTAFFRNFYERSQLAANGVHIKLDPWAIDTSTLKARVTETDLMFIAEVKGCLERIRKRAKGTAFARSSISSVLCPPSVVIHCVCLYSTAAKIRYKDRGINMIMEADPSEYWWHLMRVWHRLGSPWEMDITSDQLLELLHEEAAGVNRT